MKYKKVTLKALFYICLVVPVIANAVRPAYVAPNFKSTWMFDIDLLELKRENILAENNQIKFLQSEHSSLNLIPKNISRIHMYGNGLSKNTSAVLYGSISRSAVEDLIISRTSQNNNNIKLLDKKNITSGKQLITKLTFNDPDNSKKERVLYYADVTAGIWSVSSNIIELRRWMDYPYGYMNFKRGEKNNKLLSLWVDVKPTLKNIKKNNGDESYLLQSSLLKQTKKFFATIQRNTDFLYFATELTASKKGEINNLIEAVDLLISEGNNSNSSVLSNLLLELNKEHKGKVITISSKVSKSVFID